MAFYEIPLSPTPQAFTVMLAGVEYRMRVVYVDTPEGGWLLDINTQDGGQIACGIPLVTGADLLEQYAYLELGGGLWVGRSRYIELDLDNVWFSFDIPGLGVDQGVWQGKYDPTTGLTALDDDNYRLLLRAKIAANSWDGTVPGAKRAFDIMFEGTGTLVFVQDNHDMTMTVGVSGTVPNAVFLAILAGGYIPLKPEGVRIAYYDVTSIDGGPMFGFDSSSSYLSGFDAGAWGVPA